MLCSAPRQHLLWDPNHPVPHSEPGAGPYLGHHVESQAVDVIEIAQAEQGCEGTTGQHPESQVIPNRQAFPYYAAEGTRKEAGMRKRHRTRPTATATSPGCPVPCSVRLDLRGPPFPGRLDRMLLCGAPSLPWDPLESPVIKTTNRQAI